MEKPDSNSVTGCALAIAAAVAAADPGDRASLRRMGTDGAPLFWRLVARLGIVQHEEERWRVFTRLVALLTPTQATESIHDPKAHFGAVLADGGNSSWDGKDPAISELRLARLLAARGEARLETLERIVRAVARSSPNVDVVELAWAVLNPDGRAIARAYYARLDRAAAQSEKNNEKDKTDA